MSSAISTDFKGTYTKGSDNVNYMAYKQLKPLKMASVSPI